MIIGTTLHDWSNMFENFDVDDAGVLKVFEKSWGGRAQEILTAYRTECPDESSFRIQGKAYTDASRGNALLQAERKAALNAAPAYLYEWDWAPSTFEGRYGATHGVDLDASFHLHRSAMCGAGEAEGRRMSDRMAATWVAFAANGDPNNALIPHWPAYESKQRATMVFDSPMRVEPDHRGSFVRLIGETGPSTAISTPIQPSVEMAEQGASHGL
jgi:para-nitrobenzyl esterase